MTIFVYNKQSGLRVRVCTIVRLLSNLEKFRTKIVPSVTK